MARAAIVIPIRRVAVALADLLQVVTVLQDQQAVRDLCAVVAGVVAAVIQARPQVVLAAMAGIPEAAVEGEGLVLLDPEGWAVRELVDVAL